MRLALFPSLASALLLSSLAFAQTVYKQVGSYPLPGEGGWDYLNYDTAADRIFIAHGTSVLVVDPQGKKLGEIPSNGAHGIALVHDKGVGYSANGRSGTVTVFDLKTLKPLQEIKVGEGPDSLKYDQYSHRVLVMCGRSNDLTIIDPESNKVINTVPLGGSPEESTTAPGKVWINVSDKSELAEIDTTGLEGNQPLETHRLRRAHWSRHQPTARHPFHRLQQFKDARALHQRRQGSRHCFHRGRN